MVDDEGVPKPEIPANEERRLDELHDLGLLDTASELRFDRYTRIVAELFDFPVVLVTLVDRDRQWFKSNRGFLLDETSRDISFCAHTINSPGIMVVPDTRDDARFAQNPLVLGEPYVRFYAGVVVHGPNGHALGTLCVLDHQPREFDEDHCRWLREFGDLVENEISHQWDLERLRAAMERTAYYDALTGLANRRLLDDRLGQLIELAEREQRAVLVLLFNVSGLRLINQSFGSDAGDELLCQVGERLYACRPPGGTVARLQADEFVMCFSPASRDSNDIDHVAAQARETLLQPFLYGGHEHYVQVQIGGSVFPDHGVNARALIERASAAIRFSDDGERGGVRFLSRQESLDISQRLRIESRLQAVLGEGGLNLMYQPIIDLTTGMLAGVEALCRWHDPELGEVSSERFVPIAEQCGLAPALGQWVQETACRQLAEWQAGHDCRIPVAINVAPAELQRPDFAEQLLASLSAQGLDSGLLWLEVTERSLVNDTPQLQSNLERLRQARVRISIDDFGTGYSSLSYLGRLPLSALKIDRSFVGGLPAGEREGALVRSIINMADAFGIVTVGEGVETREQLDYLIKQGCGFAQGFLISRPVPATEIPGMRARPLV